MTSQRFGGFPCFSGENPKESGPGKDGRKSARPRVRLRFVLTLLLSLVALGYVNRDVRIMFLPQPIPEDGERWTIPFLSSPEAKRLMRYHGVNGMAITDQMAFMRRDGSWICIFHDPPTEQELKIVRRIVSPLAERTANLQARPSSME